MDRGTSAVSLSVLLTVLFVALKLTGHITWSWLWVLSPLVIVPTVGLIILAIVLVVVCIVGLAAAIIDEKRRR